MEWSIRDVARIAGTTSRTLRHYHDIGLLEPTRIGDNGYRYYDENDLLRLQRILLLRELGLGLPAIAELLAGRQEHADALLEHLQWLRAELQRLNTQIATVELTVRKLERGEQLMAEEMFDGFDHSHYREEVEERWGEDAYAKSDSWWRSQTVTEKQVWKQRLESLNKSWIVASQTGTSPQSDEAQEVAQQHFNWLREIPGIPGDEKSGPTKRYLVGLAEMYVADERFSANYGGRDGAVFVRDALKVYAERNL